MPLEHIPIWDYHLLMRIISASNLREYWKHEPFSKKPLMVWLSDVESAQWKTPIDVKNYSSTASILQQGRVVFNIDGNKFRLVVHIAYQIQRVYIKFIGTHEEYDQIDAQTVQMKVRR